MSELRGMNRKVSLVMCVVLWSLFTILGGFSTRYWHLAVTRLLMGVLWVKLISSIHLRNNTNTYFKLELGVFFKLVIIPRLPSGGGGYRNAPCPSVCTSVRPSVQMSLSRRYLSYCSLYVDETSQRDRIYTKAVPRKVIFEIFEKM